MTRVDLLCADTSPAAARRVTQKWCRDRAIPVGKSDDLTLLASEAVTHVLRLRPRVTNLELGFVDPDRIRVTVAGFGCRPPPSEHIADRPDLVAAKLFDELTDDWSFEPTGLVARQWFTVSAEIEDPWISASAADGQRGRAQSAQSSSAITGQWSLG